MTQAWIASASPRASATMTTNSTSPPPLPFGFGIASFRLPDPRRSRRHRPASRPRHPLTLLSCPRSPRPRAPLHPCPPLPQSPPPRARRSHRPPLPSPARPPVPRPPAPSRSRSARPRPGRRPRHRLRRGGAPAAPRRRRRRGARGDLEFLDLRRMQREGPLDADAKGLLADREGLAHAGALAPQHDALEDLGAFARSLDHLEVNAHTIAGAEGGKTLPQLVTLDFVDYGAHWREKAAGPECGNRAAGGMVATRRPTRTSRCADDSAPGATDALSHGPRKAGSRAPPSLGSWPGG